MINELKKEAGVNINDAIKIQLMIHCFLNSIKVATGEIECLSFVAQNTGQELNTLCKLVCQNHIYSSIQSARNIIAKLEKKGLLLKIGDKKKKVELSASINPLTSGDFTLHYKFTTI